MAAAAIFWHVTMLQVTDNHVFGCLSLEVCGKRGSNISYNR